MKMFMRPLCAILTFALLSLVQSCDVIDPPYKEKSTLPNDSNTTRGTRQQKVLLEDFTGFLCGNCPTASKEADRLEKLYKGRLIIIRIHAGPLAVPNATHNLELRTQTGNELDAYFGVTQGGIPRALINRRRWNNNLVLTRGNWAACVDSFLKEKAPATLALSTQYNPTTRQITATATIDSIQAPTFEDHISFYLIEDSIIGYQKDYSLTNQNIYDYVHNATLRGSLNGTWGEPVFKSNLSNSQVIQVQSVLPSQCKAQHCKIVAILYRKKDTSRQVLQVEQSSYLSRTP